MHSAPFETGTIGDVHGCYALGVPTRGQQLTDGLGGVKETHRGRGIDDDHLFEHIDGISFPGLFLVQHKVDMARCWIFAGRAT